MDASGVYRAAAIHVLTIKNGGISEINDFLTSDDSLFSHFGLPLTA
jgi:ketosteroid isomerase-like protein